MEKLKENYIELLKSTDRDGIDKLIEWLEGSDFFTSPASTKYHLNCEGGLLQHSIHVFDQLICQLAIDLDVEELPEELTKSAIIVALLHDVCKANFYITKERNVKNQKGEWVKEPYYAIDDTLPLGHGDKSVMIIQQFIKLTTDELYAIRWHMGGFEAKENYQYISNAFNKSLLAVDLHIADLKATYISEREDCYEKVSC